MKMILPLTLNMLNQIDDIRDYSLAGVSALSNQYLLNIPRKGDTGEFIKYC